MYNSSGLRMANNNIATAQNFMNRRSPQSVSRTRHRLLKGGALTLGGLGSAYLIADNRERRGLKIVTDTSHIASKFRKFM